MKNIAKAQSIISANPKACYRTLQGILNQAGVRDCEPVLAAARPDCGYDCDECCPVSGRHEA